MKFLITGGAGFIGSTLVKKALSYGHKVMNLDSLTYAACSENLNSIQDNPNYIFKKVDICERKNLERAIFKFQPDIIMHLAAESHVDRSIDGPYDFINTNIFGTFNMLEVSRDYWQKNSRPSYFRFHHISTDEVFGSLPINSKKKFNESTPYDPRSPYSASKASSDHLVRAWHETYNLPVIITNCSNNYGPYHFPEKLIPLVILNAIFEKPITVYGDGSNIRDWLYVEDHAEALILAATKGQIGKSYAIGGENEISNIELVKIICKILDKLSPRKIGNYNELITFVEDRPGHDQRYAIDPSLIIKELGWQPSMSLHDGIEHTVEWYLNNENWWKPLLKKHNLGVRFGLKNS